MFKRTFLLLITLAFTLLAAAACSNDEKSGAQNNEEESPQSDKSEYNESNQNNNDEKENESSDLDDEQSEGNDQTTNTASSDAENVVSSSNNELPDSIQINEEVQKDGVTFMLEDITFEEDYIGVSFNANNTTGHGIKLAAEGRAKGGDLGGITLIDDTGYEYRYIAEVDTHRIQLMDGEEVTGTVSFSGRLRDDATSLTIVFNPGESSERKPEFSFENIEIKK